MPASSIVTNFLKSREAKMRVTHVPRISKSCSSSLAPPSPVLTIFSASSSTLIGLNGELGLELTVKGKSINRWTKQNYKIPKKIGEMGEKSKKLAKI